MGQYTTRTPEALKFAKHLGKVIRAARKMRQIKAESLAYDIGITAQSISLIETGKSIVTFGTLIAICDQLDVPMWRMVKMAESLAWKADVFTSSAAQVTAQETANEAATLEPVSPKRLRELSEGVPRGAGAQDSEGRT